MADGKVARRCEPMEGRDKEAKEKEKRKEERGKNRHLFTYQRDAISFS